MMGGLDHVTGVSQGPGLTSDAKQSDPSVLQGVQDSDRYSWLSHPILVVAAASIPAILYVLYVFHYSIDVPDADDWNMIPLVVAAIHGHLTIGALWSQYVAGRPFVARLFIVAFGLFDHLNEKSIILFSAATFVASFCLLLLPFRAYLGRRLTFLHVLSLSVVWFGLADVQNALWAIQVVSYLVVFFFAAMTYVLLVPRHGRNVFFSLGIVAAIAGSFSFLEGFVLWPVGLICLLWFSPWRRRTFYESVIWIVVGVATTVFYFHGYNFGITTCALEGGRVGLCSSTYALHHPIMLARYLVVLVGNVVPTSLFAIQPRYLLMYEVLGTAICIVAAFVIIQTIRERRKRTNPLPLLLIVFALLFDLLIVEGHLGEGLLSAGIDRFPLPNVILLVGIVVYAWGRIGSEGVTRRQDTGAKRLKTLAFVTLTSLLVAQCVETTHFGITSGDTMRELDVTTARVVVNFEQIPSAKRACYFGSTVVGPPLESLYMSRTLAARNHLSVFQLSAKKLYRAQGPPTIQQCEHGLHVITASLPAGTVGTPYAATLNATGGRPPYGWYVTGTLPPGLTLDAATGVISGAPQRAGTSSFSVTALEAATTQSKPTCWACAAVAPPPLYVTYGRSLRITISSS
jgi:hypothetical protein